MIALLLATFAQLFWQRELGLLQREILDDRTMGEERLLFDDLLALATCAPLPKLAQPSPMRQLVRVEAARRVRLGKAAGRSRTVWRDLLRPGFFTVAIQNPKPSKALYWSEEKEKWPNETLLVQSPAWLCGKLPAWSRDEEITDELVLSQEPRTAALLSYERAAVQFRAGKTVEPRGLEPDQLPANLRPYARFLRLEAGADPRVGFAVHFHCAIPDGVFVMEGAQVRFEVLPAPTDAELDALLRKIARRLIRLLRPPADAPEPDTLDFLESAQHAALSAFQPARNGAPPKRKRHSAFVEGFSLHAGVHLHANDREGLARLLAYGARGPIALERLGTLPDGRLTYQLKRPLPDGRTELVLQPTELLRKLATLVPPPRRNLVRYHGLFAPHSALRAKVVASASGCARDCSPDGPVLQPEPTTPVAAAGSLHTEPRGSATASPARAPSRVPWAELLSRVFKVDVLKCENCGGRMTVLAFLTERAVVKKILEHLGLPATGPPKAPARGAAQLELDERPADELRDELPDYDS